MATRQTVPQLAGRRVRHTGRTVGWILQSLAMIVLGLVVVVFFLTPTVAGHLPLIPGLFTLAGFIGLGGAALLGR